MILNLQLLFKFYFIGSLVFFLLTYSQRHRLLEKINLLAFVTSAFFLLTFSSDIITFCSMALMVTSTFGFVLTRIRPNKQTITAVSLSLIFILLYKVSPYTAIMMLTLIAAIFCFRANNRSIEAFIILFIFPVILYLSINYVTGNSAKVLFPVITRMIGLAFIIISTMAVLSGKLKDKRMVSYALFYIGHMIFAIGVKTPETITLAVILAFMLPLIYAPDTTLLSVFNLSMLPTSPVFIIKVILLMIVMKGGMLIEAGIIVVCSLVIMGLSVADLSNIMLQPFKNKIRVPIFLQTASVAVLLLSIIYLDTVKNVIKITIRGISG
jgi:hypothetical protein